MNTVIIIEPNEWVAESVLIAVSGLKPSTIKRARTLCWMEGREYRHVSGDGDPTETAQCFYHRKRIDEWIGRMPAAKRRQLKSA